MKLFWSKDNFWTTMKISDKFAHFVGFLTATLILFIWGVKIPFIWISLLILGILWEIAECFFADGISWRDYIMDILGIFVGMLVIRKTTVSIIVAIVLTLILYIVLNWLYINSKLRRL